MTAGVLFSARIRGLLGGTVLAWGLSIGTAHAFFDGFNNTLDNFSSQVLDMVPEGVYGVRVGVGPAMDPKFRGDSEVSVQAAVLLSFRYKDLIAVDNNQLRVNFLGTWGDVIGADSPWSAGPVVHIDFGRGDGDSPKLKGLGDVGTSLELGAYVGYRAGNMRFRSRIRQDVTNGHGGLLADVDVNSTLLRKNRWSLSGDILLTWANGKYMKSYYGVNAIQSAASGLPVYRAHAGFHDVTMNLVATYDFTERWSLLGSVGFTRLLGTAAANPLVSLRGSPNQPTAALFAIYTF